LEGVAATVVNGLLFNASWFAIIMTQSSVIATSVVALNLFVHWFLLANGRTEWQLIGIVTVAGVALDQLLFFLGVFNVAGQAALAPLWLSCLWPVFATTLMHAFSSLQGRVYVASAIGAVGGGLSYIAGTRLSDVEFGSPVWGAFIVGALWAVLFPLLLNLAARIQATRDPLQSWEPPVQRALD
jgi:hypothetical protein